MDHIWLQDGPPARLGGGHIWTGGNQRNWTLERRNRDGSRPGDASVVG